MENNKTDYVGINTILQKQLLLLSERFKNCEDENLESIANEIKVILIMNQEIEELSGEERYPWFEMLQKLLLQLSERSEKCENDRLKYITGIMKSMLNNVENIYEEEHQILFGIFQKQLLLLSERSKYCDDKLLTDISSAMVSITMEIESIKDKVEIH